MAFIVYAWSYYLRANGVSASPLVLKAGWSEASLTTTISFEKTILFENALLLLQVTSGYSNKDLWNVEFNIIFLELSHRFLNASYLLKNKILSILNHHKLLSAVENENDCFQPDGWNLWQLASYLCNFAAKCYILKINSLKIQW